MVDSPCKQFDRIFEHTLFCAITPERRDEYVQALLRWLLPGGLYLAVNYMITDDDDGPPFSVTKEELHRRFSLHFSLVRQWIPRSYESRQGKELMHEWRHVL